MAAICWLIFVLNLVKVSAFLLDDKSCSGQCHKYRPGKSCQCNDRCSSHGDCCGDFDTLCVGCLGKCGRFYDSKRGCQCNDRCSEYGNCCNDYIKLCMGSTGTSGKGASKIADLFWRIDVHGYEPDELTLNYNPVVSSSTAQNNLAPHRLFTKVDEGRFSHPVYKTFIDLFDNFSPVSGQPEKLTATDQTEVEAFLDTVFTSEVTRDAYRDIVQNKLFTGSLSDYRTSIKQTWFTPFPTSGSGASDTTLFERVVLGEQEGGRYVHPQNWVRFYLLEKSGPVTYLGYLKKSDFMVEAELSSKSTSGSKSTNFFIGSSPVFEVNLVTMCSLSKASSCKYSISGTTFTLMLEKSGSTVTNAYPML